MRVALFVVGLVLAFASRADAYPQFQFTTGVVRCQACHFAPEGGALLTDYGRDEMGDTVAWGGNGQLLHGAWRPPEAIALGGDFRLAALGLDREEDAPFVTAFPMQADLYLRIAGGGFSINATGGLSGAARGRPDGATAMDYVASREHYAMYQPESGSYYVRAGRFYPVLGLRSHDHTSLARRGLGYYNLDEPYGLGGGAVADTWELHASAFVPNPFPSTSAGPRAYGGAAYFERLFDDAAVGGQARYAKTDDDTSVLVGATAKWWLPRPKLLLLGELDLQRQQITGTDLARLQLLFHAGITRVFLPGFMVNAAVARWDADAMLEGSARTTAQLDVQLFPRAHFEIHVIGRAGFVGGRGGAPDSLAMIQLHYLL